MGFFSDLKEDLSQAVNELLPGEESGAVQEETAEETMSLDEMLKNIDEIALPEDEELMADDVAEEESIDPEDGEEDNEARILAEKMNSALEELEKEAAEEDFFAEETKEEAEEAETEEEEETKEDDWDLESMLAAALTGEKVQEEKTEENKGVESTMEMNTNRTAVDETSLITAGMSIVGDISTEGSLDLVGRVTGNIDVLGKLNITGHIQGNSKAAEIYAEGAKINGEIVSEGAVKIGASTVIVGNITATSAAIAGAVKGDIDVRGPVVLDASAIVMGNIKSKSVQINNGAVIEGMCSQCYADVSPTSFFEDYKMEMKKTK